MTLMILMIVVVMTTKMQASAQEMCTPPKVEYWRSAAGGVPLRPSRVIENNQRTNMFDRILTTRDTTANKGNLLQMINRFKIRKFIASWQILTFYHFEAQTLKMKLIWWTKTIWVNKAKRCRKLVDEKNRKQGVFKKMTCRPVIMYENCFFLIDVKCQLLFFSFCLALVDRDEQRGQNI